MIPKYREIYNLAKLNKNILQSKKIIKIWQ